MATVRRKDLDAKVLWTTGGSARTSDALRRMGYAPTRETKTVTFKDGRIGKVWKVLNPGTVRRWGCGEWHWRDREGRSTEPTIPTPSDGVWVDRATAHVWQSTT